MFDNRDDAEHLLRSLELFLNHWHGSIHSWYGTSPEKLSQAAIPEPLRRLYAFAANSPGKNAWCSAFSYQDHLCPLELLRIQDGRLVFVWENQGVWQCGTLTEGNDPPVWVTFNDEPWKPLCDSLAQFLVTLCLQETVFGSARVGSQKKKGLVDFFTADGRHVSPLWLNGPFASMITQDGREQKSFHLVDDKILIMDDYWAGTNDDKLAGSLPDLFKPPLETPPEFRNPGPIWENTAFPAVIRRNELLLLAGQEEYQSRLHAERAQSYRKLAGEITN